MCSGFSLSLLLSIDQQMNMKKLSEKRKEHTKDPKERTIPGALTGLGGPRNVINSGKSQNS